jgi:hypothetical protein
MESAQGAPAAAAPTDPLDTKFEQLAQQNFGSVEFRLRQRGGGEARCLFRAPYLSEWERLQNRLVESKDRMVLFRELAGQLVLHPTRQELSELLEVNIAFPARLSKHFEETMGGEANAVEKKG